jgi:hypothetical protein
MCGLDEVTVGLVSLHAFGELVNVLIVAPEDA